MTLSATGAYTYTPTAQARHAAMKPGATTADTQDAFTVAVDDGHGGVVNVTVTVKIGPANATPTGGSGTVTDTDRQDRDPHRHPHGHRPRRRYAHLHRRHTQEGHARHRRRRQVHLYADSGCPCRRLGSERGGVRQVRGDLHHRGRRLWRSPQVHPDGADRAESDRQPRSDERPWHGDEFVVGHRHGDRYGDGRRRGWRPAHVHAEDRTEQRGGQARSHHGSLHLHPGRGRPIHRPGDPRRRHRLVHRDRERRRRRTR